MGVGKRQYFVGKDSRENLFEGRQNGRYSFSY